MPRVTRTPVAVTEDCRQLELLFGSPEQRVYELLRPIVLFGRSPTVRARETVVPRRGFGCRVVPDLVGGEGVVDAGQIPGD